MKYLANVIATLALVGSTWAQATQLVSVSSQGSQGNADSGGVDRTIVSISRNGRYVAFDSHASNLVPGDTNGQMDVFVRDLTTGRTELVSVDSSGVQGGNASQVPAISDDGRYVAFASRASNLVAGDSNGNWDIFVHDRLGGGTTRVNLVPGGTESSGDVDAYPPAISGDGRFVAFESGASDLAGDLNGHADVFVYDRVSGTTERVSVATDGTPGNSNSQTPISLSADGRYVAFVSLATNLVSGPTHPAYDAYVHDRVTGVTSRVSVPFTGQLVNSSSGLAGLSISADGRCVAFASSGSNLVPGPLSLSQDIYVRDRMLGITSRVSVSSAGALGNQASQLPSISADGRYVAFVSSATTLVSGDTNNAADVFVHDRRTGSTKRVSVATDGAQSNDESGSHYGISISGDGRMVVFDSRATNLVSRDTNGAYDVFVHDLNASGFTRTCDPSVAGVIPCPCSNPASASARGCDNSSSTGGALLSASGIAYLSMDSLVFTTSGESPTALSILVQGNAAVESGEVYGQGVRCLGGSVIRRLYTKQASGGSITVPDPSSGDLRVSSSSISQGDIIQAGESRWYLMYYRDAVVLGGCPASSTFNVTQTGRIDWSL